MILIMAISLPPIKYERCGKMSMLKKAYNFYYCSSKLAKFRYASYYEKLSVDEKSVFVESFQGDGITGNPFYLLKEICNNEKFSHYKIYVGSVKKELMNIRKQLDNHGLKNVIVVQKHTKEYCRVLATAKYLIGDVAFPLYFIKKEGQIILNTWHGTPLKGLGRSIMDNPHSIGNVQRNFLMSDYLLYPNLYTFDRMREDYMIGPFYTGKYILSGYPRNDVLFDDDKADNLKHELGLDGKKIIVYMPTWRDADIKKGKNYHINILTDLLKTLDKEINDNTVIIAKLHHLAVGSIDFSKFSKVIAFPNKYETYEVLAMADCLITDYSSVMFDFANTGRKIILHAYDCEEYQNTRSMYFGIEKLPFVITDTANELVHEVNKSYEYKPYADEIHEFIEFDNPNSSKDLVEYVFFGNKSERMKVIDGNEYHNGKKNILIYAGSLAKSGITTALMGILDHADTSEFNYLLTFYQTITTPNKAMINRFDRSINYLPMPSGKCLTYFEAACQYMYFNLNINLGFVYDVVRKISAREVNRCFCGIDFDIAIHYTGYEKFVIHLINEMNAKKIIYTHNDMLKERKSKSIVHYNSLIEAYGSFDKIAIVRETMRDEIKNHVPSVDASKIYLARNLNNIEYIKSRAAEEIVFDNDTYCNVTADKLREILSDGHTIKYIDIARFSHEKGLDRLIAAFKAFCDKNNDAYLFIVGGHGNKFEEICSLVEESGLDNIVIIKSISNPYPILNKCDVFVLSSRHEGLPMTIMEALILDKPVVSTDIPGPSEFLKSNGCGLVVENSVEGVLDGFYAYADGRLNSLQKFDAETFNKNALNEFYALIR